MITLLIPLLFDFNISNIPLILTALGTGGVIVYLLRMKKEKHIDEATKEKLLAESGKIKADADIAITDAALRMVKEIQADAQRAKEQLAKTQEELAKTADTCRTLTYQMEKMKADLTREQEKNKEMTAKIDELLAKITELLEEIAKLKKERNV